MKEHCAALIEGPSERAIDILMVFSEDKPVWSRGEIAEHFGMPRSTTYCYLTSLRSYALIVEDRHGGYRLAPRIFPLAAVAKGRCVDHDDRVANLVGLKQRSVRRSRSMSRSVTTRSREPPTC